MAKEHKKRPVIALVVLFLALVYVFSRGWLAPLQGMVLRIVSPVTVRGSGATWAVTEYIASFLRVGTLSRTVRVLENKVFR